MNYYISDLHFCCRSQTAEGRNYDNRPYTTTAEMHADMLRRWNSKVTNGDTVYILGDVGLKGKNDELITLVARLKGKKVLILGNHDDVSDLRYCTLCHDVCHYKELTDCFDGKTYQLVLCHYPILMWSGQHKGTILLYGHTHASVEEDFFQDCIARMNASEELSFRRSGEETIRAINVGACMKWMHYEPRTLKEILSATEERNEQN